MMLGPWDMHHPQVNRVTPPLTQHPVGKISPGVLALGVPSWSPQVPRNMTSGFPPTLLVHVREGCGSLLAAARPEML